MKDKATSFRSAGLLQFAALIFIFLITGCVASKRANDGYTWAKIYRRDTVIYKVGNTQLPVAISIPTYLQPIHGQVLICQKQSSKSSGGNVIAFDMFFPGEEAKPVQDWLSHFPKAFFLTSKNYTIQYGSTDNIAQVGSTLGKWPTIHRQGPYWNYYINLGAKGSEHVGLVASEEMIPHSTTDPSIEGLPYGMALVDTDSPLPPGKLLVHIFISFSKVRP